MSEKTNRIIVFRVDANGKIALGHMYRCISIAKECSKEGIECVFCVAKDSYIKPMVDAGFKVIKLDLQWDDWSVNINELINTIAELKADYLVVDSYLVNEYFFEELSKCIRVFYLDDICNKRYKVDATLHYSEWDGDELLKKLYENTDVKVFAGLKYTPLRIEFASINSNRDKLYDLMITTGGTDRYHVTRDILFSIINDEVYINTNVCVVVGRLNDDYEELQEICSNNPRIELKYDVKNMSELMQLSKFAVTAGGTTVYELMACGTNFVVFSFSEDQTFLGERLEKHNCCTFAGDVRCDRDKTIANILDCFAKFQKKEQAEIDKEIKRNRGYIDGKGSNRIAKLLLSLAE
ncbi:MAG: UDP-2,4-diacetamido-2,4,6-trideoxy-beta-L-altropyranose hydrolase [Acetatifactor sp.]|nr:UDP-2,4-diacetamido-2,4,6-trideoxy-beta-L-altropyranose hydrolase [Acetatifactor sp.]